MSDETPDQMLLRVCRTVEELTNTVNAMSQSISELMSRSNVLDGHVTNLLSQNARGRSPPAHANGVPVPPFPDGLGPDGDPNPLLRSTVERVVGKRSDIERCTWILFPNTMVKRAVGVLSSRNLGSHWIRHMNGPLCISECRRD